MVKIIIHSLQQMLLLFLLSFSFLSFAQTYQQPRDGIDDIVVNQGADSIQAFDSIGAKRYVIDNADILSQEVEQELTAQLLDIYKRTGSISFIVTKKQINKTIQEEADDLFDQLVNYQRSQNIEGSLILLSLQDPWGQHKVYISTSGTKTIERLQASINSLLDAFIDSYKSESSYDAGFKAYVKKLDAKISDNAISFEDAAGGGIAGLLAAFWSFLRKKKSYRLPIKNIVPTWKTQSAPASFVVAIDNCIDQSVSRRIIRSNSSPSFSGHRSSSGNTHGGGGRSF